MSKRTMRRRSPRRECTGLTLNLRETMPRPLLEMPGLDRFVRISILRLLNPLQ